MYWRNQVFFDDAMGNRVINPYHLNHYVNFPWALWERASEPYKLAPEGSASTDGSLAAVYRTLDSMEVWWIGDNGSVQGRTWYDIP